MANLGWHQLFDALRHQRSIIEKWPVHVPDPGAERCEQSVHRTLGHLRACQELWLLTARAFIRSPGVVLTVPHPWRVFDKEGYVNVPWEEHMARYHDDRETWLQMEAEVDPEVGGKWNKRPDTVFGLTRRLAEHENYHLLLLEGAEAKSRQESVS